MGAKQIHEIFIIINIYIIYAHFCTGLDNVNFFSYSDVNAYSDESSYCYIHDPGGENSKL